MAHEAVVAQPGSKVASVDARKIPAVVFGGSGYVAGELLRLLAAHPAFTVAAVSSESQAGTLVGEVFPHLRGAFSGLAFASRAESLASIAAAGHGAPLALFSAAPHGASAELVAEALAVAEGAGVAAHCVDLSADFRFAEPAQWEKVYGHAHGAPDRVPQFARGLPEHVAGTPQAHVGHPGCFTTSFLLAAVPLLRAGLVDPRLSYVATTGSTGAGRSLTATTHHPERRSTLFTYQPLTHRHAPEMRALASAAAGLDGGVEVLFVPQAGPFARGIHGTLQARLVSVAAGEEALHTLASAYAGSPFVEVRETMPRLQDIVGSNRAHLGVAVRGDALVVCVAIDNLVKGASGGGIQWMNRLCGLPESTGLLGPGLGWL